SRALLNVVSIWRIRSGAAWVSRSARHAWGSISWGAVIARVPFEWDVGVSSKASRGDRFYFAVDTPTGVNVLRDSYTTLPDATVACYQCHDPQQLTRSRSRCRCPIRSVCTRCRRAARRGRPPALPAGTVPPPGRAVPVRKGGPTHDADRHARRRAVRRAGAGPAEANSRRGRRRGDRGGTGRRLRGRPAGSAARAQRAGGR